MSSLELRAVAPWRFCVLSLSRRYFHASLRAAAGPAARCVVRGAPTLDPAVGDVTVRNVTVSATPRVAVPGGPQRAGSVSVTESYFTVPPPPPAGFFCFRFVFSFRPVAAGGAGRGSKGQAPPFGESYAYGQPR